jgi:hypothetical protein
MSEYSKVIGRIHPSKVKSFVVLFERIVAFYGSLDKARDKTGISRQVHRKMSEGVLTSKMARLIIAAHSKIPNRKLKEIKLATENQA